MRFGTVLQSPIPFLKLRYVKTKRQDKLRTKAFSCFFIEPSVNRLRDTYEVLLNSGSIVLRKASEARIDTRLRRYYLIVLLLPNIFTLACLPLSSI